MSNANCTKCVNSQTSGPLNADVPFPTQAIVFIIFVEVPEILVDTGLLLIGSKI